jgi:hypothetical protein
MRLFVNESATNSPQSWEFPLKFLGGDMRIETANDRQYWDCAVPLV